MKLNGELKEYRLEDDEDLFRCLTCCLGSFGIIISVRLQLSPLFYLELRQNALEFRTFLNTLPIHYTSSDHFRYMWYPHTNSGIAHHLTRVQPRSINRKISFLSRIFSWFRYSIIGINYSNILFNILFFFRSSSIRIIILFFLISSKFSSINKYYIC
jgi:L-gulonolactone oxidase